MIAIISALAALFVVSLASAGAASASTLLLFTEKQGILEEGVPITLTTSDTEVSIYEGKQKSTFDCREPGALEGEAVTSAGKTGSLVINEGSGLLVGENECAVGPFEFTGFRYGVSITSSGKVTIGGSPDVEVASGGCLWSGKSLKGQLPKLLKGQHEPLSLYVSGVLATKTTGCPGKLGFRIDLTGYSEGPIEVGLA